MLGSMSRKLLTFALVAVGLVHASLDPVQEVLDTFVRYWNNHPIRVQHAKANPSGETPNHVYEAPRSLGLTDCLIPVSKDIVEHFRAQQDLVMKFGFICPERVKHMANFIPFDS